MALNNTGNAVPSTAVLDFQDNAQVLDSLLNGTDAEVTGRTGKELKSIAYLQSVLTSLDVGSFTFADTTTGLTGTTNGQYFRVPQGSGKGFTYYLNSNGTAVGVASVAGSGQVDINTKQIQQLFAGLEMLMQSGADILNLQGTPVGEVKEKLDSAMLDILRNSHYSAQFEANFEGFDPENVVSEKTIDAAVEKSSTSVRGDNISNLPVPTSLIRIDVTTTSIPDTKEQGDVSATVKINSDGAIFSCPVNLSVQGATSAAYPKKNFNLEFLTDDLSDNVKLKLGDLMPFDTLTFKANWIDNNQFRNISSYRLWERFVKSRSSWPLYEPDNYYNLTNLSSQQKLYTGAKGFPMGYECVMYINGEFYGMGDLMSGKKRDSYNIDKNTPTQILLDTGNWTTINKVSLATTSGDIEIKAPKKPTSETTDSLAAWDSFATEVMAGNYANISGKLSTVNIIDFIIFCQLISAEDLLNSNDMIKNIQFFTLDGSRWYFMPYDLDTTFGLKWDGTTQSTLPDTDNRLGGKFWTGLISGIGQSLFNSRYKQLRDKGIIDAVSIGSIFTSVQEKRTPDIYKQERDKWPGVTGLWSGDIGFTQWWVSTRIKKLDKDFSYNN